MSVDSFVLEGFVSGVYFSSSAGGFTLVNNFPFPFGCL
jgi:hypothetical protein